MNYGKAAGEWGFTVQKSFARSVSLLYVMIYILISLAYIVYFTAKN